MIVLTSDVVFSSRDDNHELKQSLTGGVFEPVRGTPNRNVPKGVKSRPKGYFPNVVETAGYTLAEACQKGVLSHTPLLITLVSPAIHPRKKYPNSEWLGRAHGGTTNAVDLDMGSISRRTWTSPSAKRSVPFFVKVLWGCNPFCQML